jgi:transposase
VKVSETAVVEQPVETREPLTTALDCHLCGAQLGDADQIKPGTFECWSCGLVNTFWTAA